MNNRFNDSVKFVADHFREDAFPLPSFLEKSISRGWLAAAGVTGAFLCAAAIGLVVSHYRSSSETVMPKQETIIVTPAPMADEAESKALVFEDATLLDVVYAIEKTYGVRIEGNVPSEPRVSMRYEGTAEELVEIINEQFSTNLTIKK